MNNSKKTFLERRSCLKQYQEAAVSTQGQGLPSMETAPKVNRSSMVAHPWESIQSHFLWLGSKSKKDGSGDGVNRPHYQDPIANLYEWQKDGRARRTVLLMLTLVPTMLAGLLMADSMLEHANIVTRFMMTGLFLILFSWVSAGFWTAMAGFLVLLGGGDKHGIMRTMDIQPGASPLKTKNHARTAIVMPICNEDVARVFAGLRATYESLATVEKSSHFDFFILSDSYDSDICTAELDAWSSLCRAVGGFDRIFYRRRHRRVKRKSGNITDFCRRWGKNYQYMIVLDADSVMSGTCLSTLVELMETNPRAGIIQTAPRVAGRGTFYARIQQFATRVYGPLYTAGLHFWQLGESHYWGHNAIIRIAPFMRHCALAPIPGNGPLSGDILSHDFIEAALMRRAGWTVWVAYDLPGSYEEIPPNLLDELGRDRRWCLGNMMNFRLILERGIHPVYRAVFASGLMAYFSSLLWLTFLLLSTVIMASAGFAAPYVSAATAAVAAPAVHVSATLLLFLVTASLLIVPKILAIARIAVQDAEQFGGSLRLILSMLLEIVFSALAAPVRMLFHCQFVLSGLLGNRLQWKSPSRDDTETTWREGARRHGAHTILGIIWALGVYIAYPAYLVWLLPVVGALILSIPLSVISSRKSLGIRLRDMKLLLTPEEYQPPAELCATVAYHDKARLLPGFAEAVVDPSINALMIACGRKRSAARPDAKSAWTKLLNSAILHGPDHLEPPEKRLLLGDPIALFELHIKIWKSPLIHPSWHEITSQCKWLPAIIGCHHEESVSTPVV